MQNSIKTVADLLNALKDIDPSTPLGVRWSNSSYATDVYVRPCPCSEPNHTGIVQNTSGWKLESTDKIHLIFEPDYGAIALKREAGPSNS